MIDHVLGRPSVQFRKIQVFAVVSFWSLYLLRGNNHGPPVLREISRRLSIKITAWQTLVITLLWLYISRNFAKIFGLESPEPLANLYNRSYFRATWITTALDAGFWTAMKVRRKWIRDLASMVFSVYYLIAAEQADEKVRKVRGLLTVEHLRVSWNKSTTPYLNFLSRCLRPKLTRYPPRAIRIPRPPESSYKDPVHAWLYFDGPLAALKVHTKIILDIPGGGFVAMSPRNHEDKLLAWAGRTGLPVLSLDYRKAPEYPYPYALNECYDVYHTIVATRGRCVSLAGSSMPRIIVTGDSAGGNFATGLVLMILQSSSDDAQRLRGQQTLPPPEGLILMYPALDMNIGNWMTDEQMSLIKDSRMRKTNRNILRRKSDDYYKLAPETPRPSDDEDETHFSPRRAAQNGKEAAKELARAEPDLNGPSVAEQSVKLASSKPKVLKSRLAVSSMLSYFNDRILTPEMMRAMIILYIGPHTRPDFSSDFLLSPLLAPEQLLAKFPKTYFLTGERDPLVDDTVIFAGRLRQAKYNYFVQRNEMGLLTHNEKFDEKDHVEVTLIPGISHGFLQFVGFFHEAWRHIFRCARWMEEIFDTNEIYPDKRNLSTDYFGNGKARYHHRSGTGTESSGDEDRPLEMTASRENGNVSGNASGKGKGKGRGKRKVRRREDGSTVDLATEGDLLERRMKGLAGGLMGLTADEVRTP